MENPKPRPSRLARLVRWMLVLLLVLSLGAAGGWFFVVPGLVRDEIRREILRSWQGDVRVGQVQVGLDGTLQLRDVELVDPGGRVWLRVGQAQIDLGNWPGAAPVIRSIRVEGLDVQAHAEAGTIRLPVKPPSGGPSGQTLLDTLQSLDIRQATLALKDDSGVFEQWGDFSASLVRKGWRFEVSITRPAQGDPGQISILGQIDPKTLDASLEVFTALVLQRRHGQVVLAAADSPVVTSVEGELASDLTVTGRLDRPAGLEVRGTLRLLNCRLASDGSAISDDLDLEVRVDGLGGQVVQGRAEAGPWTVRLDGTTFAYDRDRNTLRLELALRGDLRAAEVMSTFWRQTMAEVEGEGSVELRGPVRLALDGRGVLEADLAGPVRAERVSIPLRPPLVFSRLTADARIRPASIGVDNLRTTLWEGRGEGCVTACLDRPLLARASPATAGPATAPTRPANGQADLPLTLVGEVVLNDVDMIAFSRQFREQDPLTRGRASAAGKLSMRGIDPRTLSGRGGLFLDDVEAMRIPILSQVLTFLGVQTEVSDLEGLFEVDGAVLVIRRARLANRLSAIEAEKGGRIDLETGRLDFYAIAVPLNVLREVLLNIPLVNLLVNLRDKLTRLQVRGHWDDPPTRLLRVTPVQNVEEGTLGFFRDVARTGGQLGTDVLKTLRAIIELPFGGGAERRKEEDGPR